MLKKLLLTAALLSSTHGAAAIMNVDTASPAETTHMEFHGILSPTQHLFTTKRFFDRDGDPYNLKFTFTPYGSNGTEYALTVLFDEGTVRRNDSQGSAIDDRNPMIIAFNTEGLVSEFDCAQPTRSTNPPLLYISMAHSMKAWLAEPLPTQSFPITWSIGQGKPLEYETGNELFPNQLISRKNGTGNTFTIDSIQNGKRRK